MDGSNVSGVGDVGLSIPAASTQFFNAATPLALSTSNDDSTKGPKTMKKFALPPKRFKSSFIFFSMAKHKEIKAELRKEDRNAKTTNITKMVSDAWKNISPEERAKYDEMAKKDRERYEQEKALYVAPPSVRKKQRDPTAPRRPMSAFLAFANSRRAKVKGERPQCSNGEISKILSNMWKEADKEIKQKYRDDEAALWAKYKADMSEWRKNNEIRLKQAKAEMEAEVEAWAARKKMRTDGVKLLQEAGLEDHMISGLPGRHFDYPNPSDEMIAATALRGVRGGSNPLLGQGLPVGLDEATLHQKHLYHAQAAANYSSLIRNGLGAAYSSGLGAANAPGGLGSNISNMALLEMGMAYPQQLAGLQFGNPQAALMAQALHGTTSAHHNPLIALAAEQQSKPLSQLASLAGSQNSSGAPNGQFSFPPGVTGMYPTNNDMS